MVKMRSISLDHRSARFAVFVALNFLLTLTKGFGITTTETATHRIVLFLPKTSFKHGRRNKSAGTSYLPDRASLTKLWYHDDDNNNDNERRRMEFTKSFLKASRLSFKNIEGATDSLLDKNPLIAMIMFLALALLVAYVSGFAILDGYIETSNPLDNAAVPYWDEDLSTPLP